MSDLLDAPPATDETAIPRLYDGDRLDREEFHRRYEAMGPGVRAELVEGIVYLHNDGNGMASPVSLDAHAHPHGIVTTWVGYYVARTTKLVFGSDGSILLDQGNEPQPDVLLGIPEAVGGQTRTVRRKDKTYVDGAPELVIEVSASTASLDLNAKLAAYARNGVREYLILLTDRQPAELRWLLLDGLGGTRLEPDPADSLLKSRVFPGLWLDSTALLAGDLPALIAAVDRGAATDDHAAFVERHAVRPSDS